VLFYIWLLGNFPGRGNVPYRSRVLHAGLFAPFFELSMLIQVKFKELPVCSVRGSVRIIGIRMRGVVFLGGKQLPVTSLLEFYNICFAIHGCRNNHFPGNLHIAFMVTANLRYYFRIIHNIQRYKKNSAERKALPHYSLHEINYLTVLMYWISSTTLLEYPHSLSYQATTFTKLGFSEIPASASKMEGRASCIKSEETTASSV
jgi:hypothetical protein